MAVTMNSKSIKTGKSAKSISKLLGKMVDKDMPIILLHYNDAKVLTADRHAYPDEGLIDPEELKNIREFAKNQSIPMVIEMAIKDNAKEMKKVYKNLQ
jgi:endonuclease IV